MNEFSDVAQDLTGQYRT